MLLLMRCAFRLFFVANAPVHFLLLAITALVLFDFGSDLSSWILCQIRIANQLQLKQVLHRLFELCFNLCSHMTASLDTLLQRNGNRIQILVHRVNWLWSLIESSQLFLAHVHHVICALWGPRMVAAAVWVLMIIIGLITSSWVASIAIWITTLLPVTLWVGIWVRLSSLIVWAPGTNDARFASWRLRQVWINILGWSDITIEQWRRLRTFLCICKLLLHFLFALYARRLRLSFMRWSCSRWIWHTSIVKIRVIVRIVHDVGVGVWLQLWLVTILIVVGNGRMLEDQRAIGSNERLIGCLLLFEFVCVWDCWRAVARILRWRLTLIHVIVV